MSTDHEERGMSLGRRQGDEDTLRRIVREETTSVLNSKFAQLGLDASDWKEVQRDVRYLRQQRQTVERVKQASLWGSITAAGSALVGWIVSWSKGS